MSICCARKASNGGITTDFKCQQNANKIFVSLVKYLLITKLELGDLSGMRKIIAITQVSLDGVMQAPGGPEEDPRNGFAHGGWAMSYGDEVFGKIIGEIVASDFDMLLGRRTYEIFSSYWPYKNDNPIGKSFNMAKKYVVTRTLNQLDWNNSQRIGDDVVSELRKLKASEGPPFHIWGSSDLLQTLIAAELVDEYRMWIVPVVLGKGKRLFENGVPARGLTLVESRCTTTGVFMNTYHPAGPVPLEAPEPDEPSKAEVARRKKLASE
ncbi:dihydrofolate reductase family protein [soil metagenome]